MYIYNICYYILYVIIIYIIIFYILLYMLFTKITEIFCSTDVSSTPGLRTF